MTIINKFLKNNDELVKLAFKLTAKYLNNNGIQFYSDVFSIRIIQNNNTRFCFIASHNSENYYLVLEFLKKIFPRYDLNQIEFGIKCPHCKSTKFALTKEDINLCSIKSEDTNGICPNCGK